MEKLEPPDSHFLNAARGWLELGNMVEAHAELRRIAPRFRTAPEALVVRWEIQSRELDWEASLKTARKLIAAAPEECDGWIKQSYSLHELKRTTEAMNSLLAVEDSFPEVSMIPYNLACYACQLGDRIRAMRRLMKAIQIAGKESIKKLALEDSDLEPMWDEIREL
jgi:tetratricopeptide (TPR) repeat protein